MTADKLKSKLKKHLTPKNLKMATEQKINPPILNQMPKYAKLNDLELKKILGLMTKSVIAMSKVAARVMDLQKQRGETMIQEVGNALFSDTFDGLALAAQACYNLNMKRVSWF